MAVSGRHFPYVMFKVRKPLEIYPWILEAFSSEHSFGKLRNYAAVKSWKVSSSKVDPRLDTTF